MGDRALLAMNEEPKGAACDTKAKHESELHCKWCNDDGSPQEVCGPDGEYIARRSCSCDHTLDVSSLSW